MKNPFVAIADEQQGAIVDRWLAAKLIDDEERGWELFESEDEWGIYTLGEVKKLAHLAGFTLEVTGIELDAMLASRVVTDLFDDAWIGKIHDLDDVYMDLVVDYIAAQGMSLEACVAVTGRGPNGNSLPPAP